MTPRDPIQQAPTNGHVPHSRRWLPDLMGVTWVIIAAGAVMAPALSHGWSLGPLRSTLTTRPDAELPTDPPQLPGLRPDPGDHPLDDAFVDPGAPRVLPLWNPYSALGAPLAFNWQSATFSLPALIGYLVPVRLDYTIQVLATLVIGGTGMYVLARVMRLGVLGAAMAATVFELSGSFISVLGWPIASVMSWSGWLFACTILVVRGRHRRRDISLFAVVLALSIYAGEPDTLVVLLVALAVFLVVLLALRVRRFEGNEAVGRPLLDLPSPRPRGWAWPRPSSSPASSCHRVRSAASGRHNAFPSPTCCMRSSRPSTDSSLAGSRSFDAHGLGWVSTADYVGVIAVVLAGVALLTIRHRPAIVAFGVVVVVAGCLVYLAPLVSFLNNLPGIAEVRWVRAIQVLGFGLAILAGAGLDALARSHGGRRCAIGWGPDSGRRRSSSWRSGPSAVVTSHPWTRPSDRAASSGRHRGTRRPGRVRVSGADGRTRRRPGACPGRGRGCWAIRAVWRPCSCCSARPCS